MSGHVLYAFFKIKIGFNFACDVLSLHLLQLCGNEKKTAEKKICWTDVAHFLQTDGVWEIGMRREKKMSTRIDIKINSVGNLR